MEWFFLFIIMILAAYAIYKFDIKKKEIFNQWLVNDFSDEFIINAKTVTPSLCDLIFEIASKDQPNEAPILRRYLKTKNNTYLLYKVWSYPKLDFQSEVSIVNETTVKEDLYIYSKNRYQIYFGSMESL